MGRTGKGFNFFLINSAKLDHFVSCPQQHLPDKYPRPGGLGDLSERVRLLIFPPLSNWLLTTYKIKSKPLWENTKSSGVLPLYTSLRAFLTSTLTSPPSA